MTGSHDSSTAVATRDDRGVAILSASVIAKLERQALADDPGVENRILWTDGSSVAGLLTVAAGHRLGAHTHQHNHHHFWVLAGSALVLGQELNPGSYVHIPSGVEHDIDARQTRGCTVYYLYLRPATG